MEEDSVIKVYGGIERQVRTILNAVDQNDPKTDKMKRNISLNLEITRKLLRDFIAEEDTHTQAKLLPQSEEQLKILHKNILDASQYDLFSVVDVAQISSNIDRLIERLG